MSPSIITASTLRVLLLGGACTSTLLVATVCASAASSLTTIVGLPPRTSRSLFLADLPWDDLQAQLSSSATLIDASPGDYVEQCMPVFELPPYNRTNHDLINQPSGLCMPHLYCAFVNCNPVASEDLSVTERHDAISWPSLEGGSILPPPNANDIEMIYQWLDKNNSNYNLPHKVLFPTSAGDVVAAVEFAKAHPGLGLSVKNSGHSYTGASTKKDTLLLNMNQYPHYAPTGLVNCSTAAVAEETEIAADLHNQPCQLAMARNKPAALRVGGGENFDKVYRAVKAYNDALPNYKYHLVGGGAGTVSPAGWMFQGGLPGTTAGRLYGFGVDQVLQIDMVLPNGFHVRLGPVEWENDPEYLYPETTKVGGVCHENPYEQDESKWVWSECPSDVNINFDDLWFAVRGGGGGTFGIVTSVYLQIHEYLQFYAVSFGINTLATCGIPMFVDPSMTMRNGTVFEAFSQTFWNFAVDFFLDPSVLDISDEESSRCSGAAKGAIYCYGEGAGDVVVTAWKNYIITKNQTLAEDMGMNYSDINIAAGCFSSTMRKGYAETILFPDGHPHVGKARDYPVPSFTSKFETSVNIILPKKWILENKDVAVSYLKMSPSSSYWAFGGNSRVAQDKASSLSDAHRNGGLMYFAPLEFLDDETFWSDVFPAVYNTSDKMNFPGFVGSNHAGPNTRGPLKSDWTKPCPLTWTESARDAQCISLQEAIWGTATLQRLESIKQAVDPNYILDCNFCVGNNRAPVVAEEDESCDGTTKVTATTSAAGGSAFLALFRTCVVVLVAAAFLVF